MPLLSRWGGSHCSIGQCQEEKKNLNAMWDSLDSGLGGGGIHCWGPLWNNREIQVFGAVRWEIWDRLLPSGDTVPRTSPFMLQEMPVETLSIRLKGCPLSTLTYLSKAAAAAAKSLQSCPTLRGPIDGSPPGPPPSLGFSRQQYWGGVPLPSP